MTAVGIFLGVQPGDGGMFQYAQSMLQGLLPLHASGVQVKVAYVAPLWQPLLSAYPYTLVPLSRGEFGMRMAAGAMAARLPGSLSRLLGRVANPVVAQMRRMDCALWLFPAQDSLGYQVDFPVISSVHDLMHRYEGRFPEVSEGGRFGIREHRFRNLVSWSKLVLVDSTVGRQHVVESYGANPAKVLPLPYVAPQYIAQPEPADFEAKYPLPAKFLFYPAQFWAHKNHQRLLSAAAAVRPRCPDIHLVFTGGHRHGYEALRQHADSLGMADRVSYPGYVPDAYLAGFYRRARALVMPTFFGPTNIPPLEAFSCGCPAAVSDIYGMPEQADGAALLFDPLSVDSMTAVLERLWLDDALCANLRQLGLAHAQRWNQAQFGQALSRIVSVALQTNDAMQPAATTCG